MENVGSTFMSGWSESIASFHDHDSMIHIVGRLLERGAPYDDRMAAHPHHSLPVAPSLKASQPACGNVPHNCPDFRPWIQI